MRLRDEVNRVEIPAWLLSPEGTFLVDATTTLRWCGENGWRALAVFAESVRRHDAARGIRCARGIFVLLPRAVRGA